MTASFNRFSPAEQVRRIFDYVASAGTTVDELLVPTYWKEIARHVGPWDRLEVRSEDGSWFAEFIVRSVAPTGVELVPYRGTMIEQGMQPRGKHTRGADGRRVLHLGEFRKWAIVDGAGEVVKDGFATESEALRWLAARRTQEAKA